MILYEISIFTAGMAEGPRRDFEDEDDDDDDEDDEDDDKPKPPAKKAKDDELGGMTEETDFNT